MKRKLTIALVAILTFSLILTGCAVLTTPTATTAEEAAGDSNAVRESDDAYSYGGGRGGYAGRDTVADIGNGGYGANGYGSGSGVGYTDSCDPIYDGSATTDPNYTLTDADKALSLAGYGSTGALDDTSLTLADMLTYAIQDEYLAYAEYDQILRDFGSVRPFANIVRAESTHIEALLPLFAAYGITAPADEGADRAVSVKALTDAFQAGVTAEVNNIAMYETFLDQTLPDNVRAVFESLMHASENHLRAFQNQL